MSEAKRKLPAFILGAGSASGSRKRKAGDLNDSEAPAPSAKRSRTDSTASFAALSSASADEQKLRPLRVIDAGPKRQLRDLTALVPKSAQSEFDLYHAIPTDHIDQFSVDRIPSVLVPQVMSCLPLQDIFAMASTCKRYNALVRVQPEASAGAAGPSGRPKKKDPTVWQLLTGVDLSRVGVPRSSAEEAALMTVSEERQAALLAFLGRQQLPRLALVKLGLVDLTSELCAALTSHCPAVRRLHLQLSRASVWDESDAQLVALAEAYPKLSELVLDLRVLACGVPLERTLSQLSALHSLSVLHGSDQGIGPGFAAEIAKCPTLTKLSLSGGMLVKDEEIKQLCKSGLRDLRHLTLRKFGFGDAGLAHLLRAFPKLQRFSASDSPSLTGESFEAFGTRGLPALQCLDLSGCAVSAAALKAIGAACANLEEIDLGGHSKFAKGALDVLTDKKHFRSLQTLKLGNWGRLNDAALLAFVKTTIPLTELHLRCKNNSAVTDHGLLSIGKGCPRLRVLDIGGFTGVSGAGLLKLLDRCPRISSLGLPVDAQFVRELASSKLYRCLRSVELHIATLLDKSAASRLGLTAHGLSGMQARQRWAREFQQEVLATSRGRLFVDVATIVRGADLAARSAASPSSPASPSTLAAAARSPAVESKSASSRSSSNGTGTGGKGSGVSGASSSASSAGGTIQRAAVSATPAASRSAGAGAGGAGAGSGSGKDSGSSSSSSSESKSRRTRNFV